MRKTTGNLAKILVGTGLVASAASLGGCLSVAAGAAVGYVAARTLRPAQQNITINTGAPAVEQLPQWYNETPVGSYDNVFADNNYNGSGTLSIHQQGVEFIGNGGKQWASIPWGAIRDTQSKEGVLFGKDWLKIDLKQGGRRIYEFDKSFNVTQLEGYVREKAGLSTRVAHMHPAH